LALAATEIGGWWLAQDSTIVSKTTGTEDRILSLREFAGQFSPCSEHQQVWISLASRPKKIPAIPGKPNARDFPL